MFFLHFNPLPEPIQSSWQWHLQNLHICQEVPRLLSLLKSAIFISLIRIIFSYIIFFLLFSWMTTGVEVQCYLVCFWISRMVCCLYYELGLHICSIFPSKAKPYSGKVSFGLSIWLKEKKILQNLLTHRRKKLNYV
jgi:hypothetical protein